MTDSDQTLYVLFERDGVVEPRFPRGEDESDLTRSNPLEDRMQRILSGVQLLEVSALELRPSQAHS